MSKIPFVHFVLYSVKDTNIPYKNNVMIFDFLFTHANTYSTQKRKMRKVGYFLSKTSWYDRVFDLIERQKIISNIYFR